MSSEREQHREHRDAAVDPDVARALPTLCTPAARRSTASTAVDRLVEAARLRWYSA